MTSVWKRREFLEASLAAAAAAAGLGSRAAPGSTQGARVEEPREESGRDGAGARGDLFLAPFRFDVTPPEGHSLCGGWIAPVSGVDDPLEAIGLVLLGSGKPIVLLAVDWTGILNEAHVEWREALAAAAGTSPERVAVQVVHQHNAPFACLGAETIVEAQGDLPSIIDRGFFRECLDRGRKALAAALERARRVTHVARGEARVEKVASSRRLLGPDGRLAHWRGSSTKDPLLHDLPEGLIDPLLKTVAFYDGERKLAACHYYATHPMSYYGDGRVSSDFAGLARKRRQAEEPDCAHLYFTGCAGNVAAGKHNDGSKEARARLTERLHRGIADSEKSLLREPLQAAAWRTRAIELPPRAAFTAAELEAAVADRARPVVGRNRPAYTLAWLRRAARRVPIVLSALRLNDITLLHLPAEAFVEYQLRAQAMAPGRFVAAAAYGDGGPWYIPTREAYPQGGYEVSVAFCDPEVDPLLTEGVRALVSGG
jgi:hypothetical protein